MPSTLTSTRAFRQAPDTNEIPPTAARIREAETQDGVVLHDALYGMQYPLDALWTKVWKLIKQRQSFNQIVENVVQECGVPRETVEEDVRTFIASLREKHLLETPGILNRKRRWFPSLTGWLSRLNLTRFGIRRAIKSPNSHRDAGDNR